MDGWMDGWVFSSLTTHFMLVVVFTAR